MHAWETPEAYGELADGIQDVLITEEQLRTLYPDELDMDWACSFAYAFRDAGEPRGAQPDEILRRMVGEEKVAEEKKERGESTEPKGPYRRFR